LWRRWRNGCIHFSFKHVREHYFHFKYEHYDSSWQYDDDHDDIDQFASWPFLVAGAGYGLSEIIECYYRDSGHRLMFGLDWHRYILQ
jgi:hypothetical protein